MEIITMSGLINSKINEVYTSKEELFISNNKMMTKQGYIEHLQSTYLPPIPKEKLVVILELL